MKTSDKLTVAKEMVKSGHKLEDVVETLGLTSVDASKLAQFVLTLASGSSKLGKVPQSVS